MNEHDKYLVKLDDSHYDCRDVHLINSELLQVINELTGKGFNENARLADLDRQVFSVQKSFDTKADPDKGTIKGLSWQMSGTQTLEDGSEIPLYWPDVTKYSNFEFEYFEKRYKECKNLFAKTEYGLMIYFGEKTPYSRHNKFKKQLFKELFELTQVYHHKAITSEKTNHYVIHFFHSLKCAFKIAETSKLTQELLQITDYIYITHQQWKVTRDGTLRVLLDLSSLMSDYFNLFQKKIDFHKVIDKNLAGAKELEKTYLWGAVYAIDQNINIEEKINTDKKASLSYKANLFEKLSLEAENKANTACVSFAENALRLYQEIKDKENIKRLEKRYKELRGKFSLMKFKQELPGEYIESMNLRITEAVENSTEEEILVHFITTPWYYPCDYIKERAKELSNQSFLLSMIPVTIMDKFGNTIEAYFTDEEKEKYNFWNSYNFYFQIGTQTMHRFFIEAYKAGKLNFNSTIGYLEKTWLNDDIERQYHGQIVNVKPIETLKPGIKRIFEELDRFFSAETYTCDFVTITDSITLKIEGLIRYLCEKIGIATFKPNKKRNEKIMFEKTLDDLLADIQDSPPLKPDQKTNFDENDRMMIKFVMTEKAGFNLRNQVAHGLLDINEYSFQNITVLFCLILKLSKYKFKIN